MKKLIKYKDKKPLVHESVYLAEGVNIIGDVKIDENTSVWFNTVIRGDVNYIKIGKNCNIQDGTIIHVSSYGFSARGKKGSPTIIGDYVTIGMNATIMPKIKIEDGAYIGAGAVVVKNVKKNEVVVGNPARFLKKIKHKVDLRIFVK